MTALSQSMRPFLISSAMALRAPPMSRSLSWRGLIWAAGGASAKATVAETISAAAATQRIRDADMETRTPSDDGNEVLARSELRQLFAAKYCLTLTRAARYRAGGSPSNPCPRH